jgi:transitional endoplasmic reticulum ATPase
MATATVIRLKVAGLPQQDIGKSIVRLGLEQARALELERGDIIEIKGKRHTVGIALPAYEEDHGLDIVRMDGLLRTNAGVGMGEEVELSKAVWQEAKHIGVAPAREGLHIAGTGEALRPTLLHRPVMQGDLISTSGFDRRRQSPPGSTPNDLLQTLFQSRPFGLMEIRLMVTSTAPKGIVRVTEQTQIDLATHYQSGQERGSLGVTYDDLGGITPVVDRVREMIELPLKHPELFDRLGIDPPRGILLYGPPGTGKTLLARAVAHESEAFFTSINGPEVMGKAYGESEERLRQIFEEADKNAPAIVFIDELDSIAPKRDGVTGEVERRIVAQLLTLMDGLQGRRKLVVIGATNRVDAIDPALRRTGRFDREIEVRIPDRDGRLEILQIHTRGMPLDTDVDLERIADVTHGFTGSDIATLAKEAALTRLRQIMPTLNLEESTIPSHVLNQLMVTRDDFDESLRDVQPSALREIVVEVPNVKWEEVGGLAQVKQALHDMVELPLKNPDAFSRLGIRAAKGILLYGPPGTGKTMIAKAAATEAGVNFLTAKGSTLLSKWYSESEKKIAEFFQRARQVAPAILFFDELDSLAPVRGGSLGEPQVTERVVNQLLTEMDGMEELRGVVVLGATNRPDRIDPALLRPGRFDEIIYVAIPDADARLQIFRSHTAHMALASDVDLNKLAEITDRFTGADITGVCMKAGIYALRENADARQIVMEHFFRALKEAVHSVTPEMEREYEKLARAVKQEAIRIGFGTS